MATHVYTCLSAPEHLVSAGFSTVVAKEDDRIPLAAFKDGAEASKWCDEKNGIKPISLTAGNNLSLADKVAAAQGKTP